VLAEGEARSGVQSVLLGCALDLSRQSLTASNHLFEILLSRGVVASAWSIRARATAAR
jgi:hypothetical protein